MSRSIWTRCGGRSNARPLACRPWRIAESQRMISTRPLVDSDAEHDLLERMIDAQKPPVPAAPAFAGLHYLLYSPFRYPPLRHGSRFGGRHEPSLWYGSEELRTALGETAYYRIVFFEATAAKLAPHQMPFSAFQVKVSTRAGVDLSSPAFESVVRRIAHPRTTRRASASGPSCGRKASRSSAIRRRATRAAARTWGSSRRPRSRPRLPSRRPRPGTARSPPRTTSSSATSERWASTPRPSRAAPSSSTARCPRLPREPGRRAARGAARAGPAR